MCVVRGRRSCAVGWCVGCFIVKVAQDRLAGGRLRHFCRFMPCLFFYVHPYGERPPAAKTLLVSSAAARSLATDSSCNKDNPEEKKQNRQWLGPSACLHPGGGGGLCNSCRHPGAASGLAPLSATATLPGLSNRSSLSREIFSSCVRSFTWNVGGVEYPKSARIVGTSHISSSTFAETKTGS